MASKHIRSDPLAEIEKTQTELRKSLDRSKELVEKSQRLLDRHRQDLRGKH